MRRLILLTLALLASTALSASLAACQQVSEGGSPSTRVSPSSSPTATNTPTPTETTISPTSTPTATEKPTPTEAPRMTLENWKEVFTGPIVADNGKTYDLGIILLEDANTILTDPNQIKILPLGTPITILNPDGTIIIYADPDVAAERAKGGAIILVTKDVTPTSNIMYALTAVTLQHQKGNKNFYVQISGNSASGEFFSNHGVSINLDRVLQIILDDGTIITPIMGMPEHFKVGHAYQLESLTLEQAGIKITNPNNWLDQVIKAGYTQIIVYPQE